MVTLLDDTDESIIQQVTRDLIAQGTELIPRLEHYWEKSTNSLIQARLEQIIHKVQFAQIKQDLQDWVNLEEQ